MKSYRTKHTTCSTMQIKSCHVPRSKFIIYLFARTSIFKGDSSRLLFHKCSETSYKFQKGEAIKVLVFNKVWNPKFIMSMVRRFDGYVMKEAKSYMFFLGKFR